MRTVRRVLAIVAVPIVVIAAVALVRLDGRVRAYLAGPALGAVRIYAAPTMLRRDAPVPGGSLARKLARLGYRQAEGGTLAPGTYRMAGGAVELTTRSSPAPWGAASRAARIAVQGRRVSDIRSADGAPLDALELEPEVLATLGQSGGALDAGADPAPPACRAAVLAAEDRRFFRHPGIDPTAVARALLTDLRAGGRRQGGSTLSQQLAKNVFLTPRRTLSRKVREAMLALLLEAHASKEEILRRYLASVYLGEDGAVPIHGFAEAAEAYFAKPLGDLGPAECALLAGIIRSPNGLSPRQHGAAAVARRNRVVTAMVEDGALDEATGARARAEPLRLAAPRVRPVGALYVADEVAREISHLLPPDAARAPGLAVFTAIDPDAQREAERAVRRRLDGFDRIRPPRRRDTRRLQAALLAIDPASGRIQALVGGRDYGSSPLDRAVRARRQPGSAFKPFVYLAALDPARNHNGGVRTVVSPLDDVPLAVPAGARMWRPVNYDGVFHGSVPVEDALAESMNAATARLALDVGLDTVVAAAGDVGIPGPLPAVPALALGVAETSLLDLTAAYGVFATGGIKRPPQLVVGITSSAGETLYAAPTEETSTALRPARPERRTTRATPGSSGSRPRSWWGCGSGSTTARRPGSPARRGRFPSGSTSCAPLPAPARRGRSRSPTTSSGGTSIRRPDCSRQLAARSRGASPSSPAPSRSASVIDTAGSGPPWATGWEVRSAAAGVRSSRGGDGCSAGWAGSFAEPGLRV